jgi:hypothetical protein
MYGGWLILKGTIEYLNKKIILGYKKYFTDFLTKKIYFIDI